MKNQVSRWLKAGALMFVAVLVIAACEGPAGIPGEPGKAGQPAEAAGIPPQVTQQISPITLVAGKSASPIDLSDHFFDPDAGEGKSLSFTVSSDKVAVASGSVSVADGMLTVRASTMAGVAKLTITATDPQDLSNRILVTVTVMETAAPNQAPTAVGSILEIDVMIDETEAVDVASAFSDPDEGDTLTYTPMASDMDVAVSVSGSTVSITGKKVGTSRVTVTATDPGGLSATQTITVTVDAPARGAAPAPAGSIMDISLAAGEASAKMDVSGYFHHPDGDTLTYAASSSADMVATDSINGNMLQVIAGRPATSMTATITVTATDPDGQTAIQRFMVSVTADATPPPKDPKFSITLPSTKVGDYEVDLDSYLDDTEDAKAYTLVSDVTRHFTVALKENSTSVWKITPVQRGTAKAYIQHKATGTNKETITVTIINSNPEVDTAKGSPQQIGLTVPVKRSTTPNEDGDPALYNLRFYEAVVKTDWFKDADTEDNAKLTYEFEPSRTDVKIVKGDKCMAAMCTLEIDVIDGASVGDFDLRLKAMDPVDAVSDAVMIPVLLRGPLSQKYLVDQHSKGFRPVTVGYRNSKHTMVLGGWPDDSGKDDKDKVGFYFAEADIEMLKDDKGTAVKPSTAIGSAPGIEVMDAAPIDADSSAGQVIVIKAEGRVKDIAPADLTWEAGLNPMLMFSVEGVGSGKITLTYYVWAYKDGKDPTWKKAAEATIMVTVKAP